jgi:enoyl-CoA hydratase
MSDHYFDRYPNLRFERKDHGILLLTIDRPEHYNATDAPLRPEPGVGRHS